MTNCNVQVSEELSSVETATTHNSHNRNAIVSEELSSVETDPHDLE